MYYSGHGVPQDYVRAGEWFILAKDGGVEQANKALSLLEQHMTPAQIAEAPNASPISGGKHITSNSETSPDRAPGSGGLIRILAKCSLALKW